MYFKTPSVNAQEVPHFVNNTNNGYHPVDENYATSSANLNEGCSSDRPVSARELAELIVHSRKDHLPELHLSQFDGYLWYEWYGKIKSTVNFAVLRDDT